MDDLNTISVDALPSTELLNTYFLDLATAIRWLMGKINTIRDMTSEILKTIPEEYSKKFIVCDTYKDDSIKGEERISLGNSERYLLNNPDMKVPCDMPKFPKNGENKESLFNLIERAIDESKQHLNKKVIYFSNRPHCRMISRNGSVIRG